MYGLVGVVSARHEVAELAQAICNCLDFNGRRLKAKELLVGTAGVETRFGAVSNSKGIGLCQVDEILHKDTVIRTADKHATMIDECFGIDIRKIEWEALRYNPLLSLIICRLRYKLILEPLPDNEEGRAKYWCKQYRLKKSKNATPEYYLEMNRST